MRYLIGFFALVAFISISPVHAQTSSESSLFDNGKMWTFEYAPVDFFEETYEFDTDDEWFERARMGALRIPGCTASFVSSYGLMLTNHHCSRRAISAVSEGSEELLEQGFYAKSVGEERQVPGMYADQLIAMRDVTEDVQAALDSAQTIAEKAQFQQDAIQRIQEQLKDAAKSEGDSIVVEVVSLYHGARYSAYTFKRYTDLRLVMAPEMKLGYFGGDTDNFTFPRYTLDITFFRVYENNVPFETEHFFLWSLEGVQPDDAVFVVGNPGSTSRLETVAQLELRKEVTDKNLLTFLESRIKALESAEGKLSAQEEKSAVKNFLFSLRNAQKAYTGQLATLADPAIMARRMDAEERFLAAIMEESSLSEQYGDVISEMALVQDELRELSRAHGAFFALSNPTYSSALMRRALLAHQFLMTSGDQREALKQQIMAIPDQSAELGLAFLAARFEDFKMYFGENDDLVTELLGGRAAEAAAMQILEQSALASLESTMSVLENEASLGDDPAVNMVRIMFDTYQDFQSAYAGLVGRQDDLGRSIGKARFDVYGTSIPPDATFSLRIADGKVKGYPYNGTFASPFTSYYGLYDHYHSYGAGSEWDLPDRWLQQIDSFDRSVPLNFTSTNDIIGGNSGSPVLNIDLELVGVIFDGNIESLAGNYIYLPEKNRSVSVDARGILEALDEVYQANRIVVELTNDSLVGDPVQSAN